MATGSHDSDTARKEQLLEEGREGRPLAPYKALWAVLLLGWIVSYADRTLTGPVIAWMIQNKAGFIGDAANPATLGGLVGSMFFLGYMLTQYPGGRLGDQFGHREMIIVSLLWAARDDHRLGPRWPASSPSSPPACSPASARASSTPTTAP